MIHLPRPSTDSRDPMDLDGASEAPPPPPRIDLGQLIPITPDDEDADEDVGVTLVAPVTEDWEDTVDSDDPEEDLLEGVEPETTAPDQSPPPRKRRGGWALGCAAVAGILLIGGAVVLVGGVVVVGAVGAGAIYAVSADGSGASQPSPRPALAAPADLERAGMDAGGSTPPPASVGETLSEPSLEDAGSVVPDGREVPSEPQPRPAVVPVRSAPSVARRAPSAAQTPTPPEPASSPPMARDVVEPRPAPADPGDIPAGSSSDLAQVSLTGAKSARLTRGGQSYELPGDVPAGKYDLIVSFDGDEAVKVASVRTRKGARITVRCNPAMGLCRVQ